MNLDALSAAPLVLDTPRLILRPLGPEDTDDAATFFGDPEVGQHTTWYGLVSHLGLTAFLDTISQLMAAREMALWVIVPKDEGRATGFACLYPLAPADQRAELGYAIAQRHWGKGYATEAAGAVVAYAFDTLNCNRIEAFCTVGNDASYRVLEKIGLQYEGTLRQYTTIADQPRDRAIYAILRTDWQGRNS